MSNGYSTEGGEKKSSKRIVYAILGAALLIALGLALGLGLGLRARSSDTVAEAPPATTPQPAETVKSKTGAYKYAATAGDAKVCSDIGADILARHGGSAVDATIAMVLCSGVMYRQSCGIGGGFFMTVYNRTTKTAEVLDARERAPLAANESMYIGGADDDSTFGGRAIGVPGEVKGYWEAHQRYGRIPWRDLFQPAIKLCREGVPILEPVHTQIIQNKDVLKDYSGYAMYFDSTTGEPKNIGDIVTYPVLADTLETIAEQGADAFYTGSLTAAIVQDIQDKGGIITAADLSQYAATWKTPVTLTFRDNMTLYTVPPPSSGVIVAYLLNILDGYDLTSDSVSTTEKRILTYHRIVEAMKFAFGERSKLGDSSFVDVTENVQNMTSRQFADAIRAKITDDRTQNLGYYGSAFQGVTDSGTTHASVVDVYGNAVGITTTINTFFGSKVRGSRTGIAFNNEMDDFSTPGTVNFFGIPASPTNFIRPGKRPMSSMSPTIFVNQDGDVRLVVGASGGPRIITTIVQIALDVLKFGLTVEEALDRERFHHQLLPNRIRTETDFPQAVANGFRAKGHNVTNDLGLSVSHVVQVKDGWLYAGSDKRRGGEPSGY